MTPSPPAMRETERTLPLIPRALPLIGTDGASDVSGRRGRRSSGSPLPYGPSVAALSPALLSTAHQPPLCIEREYEGWRGAGRG